MVVESLEIKIYGRPLIWEQSKMAVANDTPGFYSCAKIFRGGISMHVQLGAGLFHGQPPFCPGEIDNLLNTFLFLFAGFVSHKISSLNNAQMAHVFAVTIPVEIGPYPAVHLQPIHNPVTKSAAQVRVVQIRQNAYRPH